MGSLPSKNKNVKYLLCSYVYIIYIFIDVSTKYAWVKSLKDKKGKTFLKTFIEIAHEYLIANQINYGLIKEENFIINLCKNG